MSEPLVDRHPEPGRERGPDPGPDPGPEGDQLSPLPGEPGIPEVTQQRRGPMSKKGLLAAALMVGLTVIVVTVSIRHFTASGKATDPEDARRAGDRPAAATTAPRRLEMPQPAASAAVAAAPRIPALVPTAEEVAEPIGVRRTGSRGNAQRSAKAVAPEDAPVMLVSTRPGAVVGSDRGTDGVADLASPQPSGAGRPEDPLAATARNLQGYQRQLQGVLDTLTRGAAIATGQGAGLAGAPAAPTPALGALATAGAGLLGGSAPGSVDGSSTPRVAASTLGDRSLVLPKGTAFTCALKTKVISAAAGLVGCQVQRNVYGDDGRVLLIERGSHLDGEYHISSVRPGTVRIPVLWTRLRTPHGVTVDIGSPATGALGEAGIDGHVDNRWGERIGAAMLLSLIDDSVKLVIQNQAVTSGANTILLPSTTAGASRLAEKVLDSTINIPPLVVRNQGGIVGIHVARDVDFASVYELRPTAREGQP